MTSVLLLTSSYRATALAWAGAEPAAARIAFEPVFAIAYALGAASLLVALLSVVTTLFALVVERRDEIALLRSLGLRRRGVSAMIVSEAAFIGILACAFGAAVAFAFTALIVFAIDRPDGWSVVWTPPYALLLATFGAIVAAVLAGSIAPARLAARLRFTGIVRSE